MITKTESLMRCPWSIHDRANPRGSGYCVEQGVTIERWTEWRLWGMLLWRKREFVRELAPHEWISCAALGSEL